METRVLTDLEIKLSDVSRRLFYLHNRRYKFFRNKTCIEALTSALHHFKYTPDCDYQEITPGEWKCILNILNVEIGSGTGHGKQKAKDLAFEISSKNLMKSYCRVIQSETNLVLETSECPFPEILNPINAKEEFQYDPDNHEDNRHVLPFKSECQLDTDLSKFVLFKFTDGNRSEILPYVTLFRSARLSEMIFEMDYRMQNDGFECIVSIGGQPIVEDWAKSKILVRESAAEKALEYLSSVCWTLYKKRKGNNQKLVKETVLKEIEKVKNKGLSGSKNESHEGTTFVTRQGFAKKNSGKDRKFNSAVFMAMQDHITFSTVKDLAFDSTFTINEIEKVCNCAKKYDVVVSKKFMNHQIYTVISKKDGTACKTPNMIDIGYGGYFVVPPTGKCSFTPVNLESLSPEIALDHDIKEEIRKDDNESGSDAAGYDNSDKELSHRHFKQEKDSTEFDNTNTCDEMTLNQNPDSDPSQWQNVEENISSSKRYITTGQQEKDTEHFSKKMRPNFHQSMPYHRPSYNTGRPYLPHSCRPQYHGPPYSFPPHSYGPPIPGPPYGNQRYSNRPQFQQPYDNRHWYTDDYSEDVPYSQGPLWFN